MHRCADLPPTKFEHIECTSTIEDYLNYSQGVESPGALLGALPFAVRRRIVGDESRFLIDNRRQPTPPDRPLATSYRPYASHSEPNNVFFASPLIREPASLLTSTTSAAYRSSVVNESMSSTDNFNAVFSLRDNQTMNCINWNRYYTKCKAGDKNPFQGTVATHSS